MICPFCFELAEPAPSIFGEGPCSDPHCLKPSCCSDCTECSSWFEAIEPEEGKVVHPKANPKEVAPAERIYREDYMEIPVKQEDIVTLTKDEIEEAIEFGTFLRQVSLNQGLKDKHGFEGDGLKIQIDGALGEKAVSKRLGIPWDRVPNVFRRFPDLGLNVEVRSTEINWYGLRVRADDHDDRVFILVTGKKPIYSVRGYITGKEAKNPEWERNPKGRGPCFIVPQKHLRPVSDLIKDIPKRSDPPEGDIPW